MYLLRGSSLQEAANVRWATLRRKHFPFAQGTGQITVLASTIYVVYIEMQREASP
jgi:hypothetical protein